MNADIIENAWVADHSGHDRNIITDLDELEFEDYPEPEIDRMIDRIIATANGTDPWVSQTCWR